jgi:hypothetical protein
MERYDADDAANPQRLAERARAAFARPGQPPDGGHDHGRTSVREAEYKGHRIRIETTYHITIDGRPVTGHLMVNNAGLVHYHSIPNQEFVSAVDMVKRIIDLTPPNAGDRPPGNPTPDPAHPEHNH